MEADKLKRWSERLKDLPQLTLPTDYPRPSNENAVEARERRIVEGRVSEALMKLALHSEDKEDSSLSQTSPFHLLLAAFVCLLHRYTGDNDVVVATSSSSSPSPLLLRIKLDSNDSFWSLVKRIEFSEREAEDDKVSYEALCEGLGFSRAQDEQDGAVPPPPPFRVRFFDETDRTEQSFLDSSSLTSDMTIFVSTLPATADSTSSRSLFKLPSWALTLAYNSLIFSQSRISFLIDQMVQIIVHAASHPLDAIGTLSLVTSSQRDVLPDPTADLHWTGYVGAITDIFHANAAKHPARTCLVESITADHGLAEAEVVRTFDYETIDRASSLLAHYLVSTGIQREDVVTVYSTRSAELVVAVMGVLKAGATFSVIDPAYPASRQNVYLDVAKPRGLVMLAAAGDLLPTVRNFVSEKLSIVTEVSGLRLQDDGTLSASLSDAERSSVFQKLLAEAHEPPQIPLGPDSVATLSFTSGSTGIPKGVKGRHYSLTHFFPWMAETFGLSDQSKFTMLSGIAHDPIQRDIFTPLFLGAQLHIPTAEHIGTPGRLAKWMADSSVTVTHLTPAMGQLLSAQATDLIPSLENAFFVGDILTKRDCTRLQQLANNVRIINMFGTTETQRAVSYFAIPPLSTDASFLQNRKDTMPAGKGMVDVQLLVVNRTDKNVMCAIGEIGEIYVRSGGLAEGYLGLPEASSEKFVDNWFGAGQAREDSISKSDAPWKPYWKGVRDRMYRTGDLGRYMPDGSVECTGRADDQIKIRGFRIELGEIDTHLSRHAAVRENVTLVRRDKYEEKVLVSYFVPMFGSSALESLVSGGEDDTAAATNGKLSALEEIEHRQRRYRKLIKDIREYLKTKLPSYSIPTVFVPLARMPLNPNGKVDKPALPFPDTVPTNSVRAAAPSEAMTPTQKAIYEIWLRLLVSPPSEIGLDESFFDVGGHSILATRLVFELRKTLAVNAPLGLVFDFPTIRGLAARLDALRNADLGLQSETTETLSSESSSQSYADDFEKLAKELPRSYPPNAPVPTASQTVFLTGATGFLGAYILQDLLVKRQVSHVICHVRASSKDAALDRLRQSGLSRNAWNEAWVQQKRLSVVTGDLEADKVGIATEEWDSIAQTVDSIVHNGAVVHWVYPYEKLRSANVLATLSMLNLAQSGKPKALTFVSTTAVLEKPQYVRLSDSIQSRGGKGVPESDPLELARNGLKGGYGQTKWVAERLVMEAGKRGLSASIVRPAYIVGDTTSATTNTDDFLWRLVKGCVQLGHIPDIHNSINMVPVDHVAAITSLAVLKGSTSPTKVYHVTANPCPRFNDFLSALSRFGYDVKPTEYLPWRRLLEQHVLTTQDNALYPLLHFVLDDLPTSTKTAALDDTNTAQLLETSQTTNAVSIDDELIGKYLAWLVAARFLERPSKNGALKLPEIEEGSVHALGRTSGHTA